MKKTILLWRRKRSRAAKQVGLATASGSALTIYDYSKMALRGDGVFFVIDAPDVNAARAVIKLWDEKSPVFLDPKAVPVSDTNGRIIAIGHNAVQALKGAGASISKWEERRMAQGAVTVAQSRALGGVDNPPWRCRGKMHGMKRHKRFMKRLKWSRRRLRLRHLRSAKTNPRRKARGRRKAKR